VLLAVECAATSGVAVAGPLLVNERAGDPIAATAWLAAIGLSAWLLLSTACCIVLELLPRAPVWFDRVVRHLTHHAVRAAVAGGLTFGSPAVSVSVAMAADAPTPPVSIRTGRDITVHEPEPTSGSTDRPPSDLSSAEPDAEHRVAPGDNLWAIAAARLTTHFGRPPTEPEIARYWAIVVDVNRSRVRSGDPDLIFPGELVALPPL